MIVVEWSRWQSAALALCVSTGIAGRITAGVTICGELLALVLHWTRRLCGVSLGVSQARVWTRHGRSRVRRDGDQLLLEHGVRVCCAYVRVCPLVGALAAKVLVISRVCALLECGVGSLTVYVGL